VPIYKLRFAALLLSSCVLMSCLQAPARAQAAPSNQQGSEYSGMYSFLREGEFVQVTVEPGRVTGFVSRYGDTETDRGEFLDHFFKQGKLDGTQLSFTTDVVHGVSYEFHGTIERGEGKNPGNEAYYLLKGTLIVTTIENDKTASSRSTHVILRSFPQELSPAQADKK
jgi:hypothetical protein